MMYLIAQTWLFLTIACLIGMLMMYFLVRAQKSERQSQLEAEALDARHRAITVEKEIEEYRSRLAELEGLPQGARASRIAAREELETKLTQVEHELASSKASEKRSSEEAARLHAEVDTFRTRYLEARAKWDEYQAKAEALASAPQPLNLATAQIVPDESMRKRVLEVEGKLSETVREKERIAEQARSLLARTNELEKQLANSTPGMERQAEITNGLRARVGELEGVLSQALKDKDAAAQQNLQLNNRIRDLEAVVASATFGHEKTEEVSKSLSSRITELEASLVIASHERDLASQQYQTVKSRLAEAELQAAGAEQKSEKSAEATRILQARISELEGRLSAGIASARENDSLRSRVADLQDKLGEAEVALRRSITTLKQETDPLRARVSELETRLAHAAATNTQGDTIAALQSADNVELRAKLSQAEERAARAEAQAAEVDTLRKQLAQAGSAAPVVDTAALDRSNKRINELETALERAQVHATEAQSLQRQLSSVASQLAEAQEKLSERTRETGGEDVSLLKARLADVESRLLAASQSSQEYNTLRHRIVSLEALLHEAAKSRDEAAVLRVKVAELDGRLGQAMKAAAEARARNITNEAV